MMHPSERARGDPGTRPVGVRHLFRSCAGTTSLEFALVALPFVTMLLGIIDFSRLIWTQSELQFAVEKAARCAAVNTKVCKTPDPIKTSDLTKKYAKLQMSAPGILAENFSYAANACGSYVSITTNFTFTLANLMPFAVTLKAQSCYPSQL